MSTAKKLLLLVVIAISVSCTDSGLRNYKGDGTISKLSGLLLGVSGYAVVMPGLDLSKSIDREYSLKGLPRARAPYNIYLVVSDSDMGDDILAGSMKMTLSVDGKVYTFSGSIKQMINNAVGAENRFYFYDIFASELLKPNSSMTDIKIAINYKNDSLSRPVKTYILVKSGGYK